jgi:hypothetical protein
MSAEIETTLLGGFDNIEFEGMDDLVELIGIIKGLNEQAYKFVMQSTMRRTDT